MYIDERLLKILETHKSETVDVNFMISLIKTIAEEHETEQLRIGIVSNRRELLIAYEVKKHPFLADKYKLEYATKFVDKYLKSN